MLFLATDQAFGQGFDPTKVSFLQCQSKNYPEGFQKMARDIWWPMSQVAFLKDRQGSIAIVLIGDKLIEVNQAGMPYILLQNKANIEALVEKMEGTDHPVDGVIKILREIEHDTLQDPPEVIQVQRKAQLDYIGMVVEILRSEVRAKYTQSA